MKIVNNISVLKVNAITFDISGAHYRLMLRLNNKAFTLLKNN